MWTEVKFTCLSNFSVNFQHHIQSKLIAVSEIKYEPKKIHALIKCMRNISVMYHLFICSFPVIMESSVEILKKLLERGAVLNCVDRHGQTCLMQAVLSGRQDVVKLLVDSGVDLASCNVYHNTALDMAWARNLEVSGMLKLILFFSKGKGKVIPVLSFLTEHHVMKAY